MFHPFPPQSSHSLWQQAGDFLPVPIVIIWKESGHAGLCPHGHAIHSQSPVNEWTTNTDSLCGCWLVVFSELPGRCWAFWVVNWFFLSVCNWQSARALLHTWNLLIVGAIFSRLLQKKKIKINTHFFFLKMNISFRLGSHYAQSQGTAGGPVCLRSPFQVQIFGWIQTWKDAQDSSAVRSAAAPGLCEPALLRVGHTLLSCELDAVKPTSNLQ